MTDGASEQTASTEAILTVLTSNFLTLIRAMRFRPYTHNDGNWIPRLLLCQAVFVKLLSMPKNDIRIQIISKITLTYPGTSLTSYPIGNGRTQWPLINFLGDIEGTRSWKIICQYRFVRTEKYLQTFSQETRKICVTESSNLLHFYLYLVYRGILQYHMCCFFEWLHLKFL